VLWILFFFRIEQWSAVGRGWLRGVCVGVFGRWCCRKCGVLSKVRRLVESAASCRKCGVVVESAASLSKVQRRCLKCGVVAHSEFLSATRDSLFYYGAFFFPDNNNVDK
jgi:hypothetical protein